MIVLFSGPAAGGKSTICKILERHYSFVPIKSSKYLRKIALEQKQEITREALQEIGDRLDDETDFRWLVDVVAIPQIDALPNHQLWFVDSVRKKKQIEYFRSAFSTDVVHVHLTASEEVLQQRFIQRDVDHKTTRYEKPYDEHIRHPNEVSSRSLRNLADLVFDTSDTTPVSICDEILMELNSI